MKEKEIEEMGMDESFELFGKKARERRKARREARRKRRAERRRRRRERRAERRRRRRERREERRKGKCKNAKKFIPLLIAARGAFLGLLRLNFLGLASRINQNPNAKQKMLDEWCKKWGGNWVVLKKAIEIGASKKPLLRSKKWIKKHLKSGGKFGYDNYYNYYNEYSFSATSSIYEENYMNAVGDDEIPEFVFGAADWAAIGTAIASATPILLYVVKQIVPKRKKEGGEEGGEEGGGDEGGKDKGGGDDSDKSDKEETTTGKKVGTDKSTDKTDASDKGEDKETEEEKFSKKGKKSNILLYAGLGALAVGGLIYALSKNKK